MNVLCLIHKRNDVAYPQQNFKFYSTNNLVPYFHKVLLVTLYKRVIWDPLYETFYCKGSELKV